MKRDLLRRKNIIPVAVAIGTAAIIIFVGLRLAAGEPTEPMPPPQDLFGTVIPVPSDAPRGYLEPEPTFPSSITIRGVQVPLARGMTYGQGSAICDPPCPPTTGEIWRVVYDSEPAQSGHSWLAFDENFRVLGSWIRPEDEDEFQPLIDELTPGSQ